MIIHWRPLQQQNSQELLTGLPRSSIQSAWAPYSRQQFRGITNIWKIKTKGEDLPGEPQLYDFQGWKPEGGEVMLRTKPQSGTHMKHTGINKRTIGRCRVTTEKKQLYRHKSRDMVHVLIYVYGPLNRPPWSKKRSMKMDRHRDHLGRYIRTLIHVLSLVLCDQSIYSNIGYISSSTHVH